jgi:hypothetical protein
MRNSEEGARVASCEALLPDCDDLSGSKIFSHALYLRVRLGWVHTGKDCRRISDFSTKSLAVFADKLFYAMNMKALLLRERQKRGHDFKNANACKNKTAKLGYGFKMCLKVYWSV